METVQLKHNALRPPHKGLPSVLRDSAKEIAKEKYVNRIIHRDGKRVTGRQNYKKLKTSSKKDHLDDRKKYFKDAKCAADIQAAVLRHFRSRCGSRWRNIIISQRFRALVELAKRKKSTEEAPVRRIDPVETWRRMARIVRMLCAVCIALRKYAIDAGLLENYMVNVANRRARGDGGSDDEDLSFDIEDFKLSKEPHVPVTLVRMMEKLPHMRCQQDITAISNMMRNLPSFRKYTHDMQQLMCRIVRYMQCGRRRVVLRKGHIGYSVYFIFSGTVSVILDTDDQNIFIKQNNLTLKKGACFGEIALMQNTRRNATIVCAEKCEFLVIDKEDFLENGLDRQMHDEITRRFSFFRNWPVLEHWSDEKVHDLSYISRTENFNHNRILVKDSHKNEWLWFIVEGSCDVLRLVDVQKSADYSEIVSLNTATRERFFASQTAGKPFHTRALSAPYHPKYRPFSKGGVRPCTVLGHHKSSRGSSDHDDSDGEGDEKSEPGQDAVKNTSLPRRVSTASRQSESSKRSVAFDKIRAGVFVRIDTLRDGMCFGLDELFEERCSSHLSVVSKGCTVIHVPRSRFEEMADNKTINRVQLQLRPSPSERELCHKFLEKSKWDSYKNNVVKEVVEDRKGHHRKFRDSAGNVMMPAMAHSAVRRKKPFVPTRPLSTCRTSVQFASPTNRKSVKADSALS